MECLECFMESFMECFMECMECLPPHRFVLFVLGFPVALAVALRRQRRWLSRSPVVFRALGVMARFYHPATATGATGATAIGATATAGGSGSGSGGGA
jgi:hypothetical protein